MSYSNSGQAACPLSPALNLVTTFVSSSDTIRNLFLLWSGGASGTEFKGLWDLWT